MSLQSFLTKPRSRERTVFAAIGSFLTAYGIFLVFHGAWGAAIFLVAAGVVLLSAARVCSERTLAAIGVTVIVVNVAVAAIALATGNG
jgi:hypothetical protein